MTHSAASGERVGVGGWEGISWSLESLAVLQSPPLPQPSAPPTSTLLTMFLLTLTEANVFFPEPPRSDSAAGREPTELP